MTGVSPAERRRISLTAIGEFLLVVLFVFSLPVLFIWTLWLFWAVLAAALVVGLLVRGLATPENWEGALDIPLVSENAGAVLKGL